MVTAHVVKMVCSTHRRAYGRSTVVPRVDGTCCAEPSRRPAPRRRNLCLRAKERLWQLPLFRRGSMTGAPHVLSRQTGPIRAIVGQRFRRPSALFLRNSAESSANTTRSEKGAVGVASNAKSNRPVRPEHVREEIFARSNQLVGNYHRSPIRSGPWHRRINSRQIDRSSSDWAA